MAPRNNQQLANFAPGVTAYDGHRDSYSYIDALEGQKFTVSEQPLPTNLGKDPLSKVALQVGAPRKLDYGGGTAYFKDDAQTGSQVAVLAVGKVLLLVNSPSTHKDQIWKIYFANLQ